MSLYTKIIDIQKLRDAWSKVRKNKPAAGVDNITYDQFEESLNVEINTLNRELLDHTYRCRPVKIITIYKGEKSRDIALYSMRDKVVQQSIASELNKIFDKHFSEGTFAYRNNKSALNGIEIINETILSRKYKYYLKADISHYFDTIQWKKLLNKLRQRIGEEDVLELIRDNSCSCSLDMTDGEIIEKKIGIFQGSGISPILSNIYLMDIDNKMYSRDLFYLRYSDDLIILGKTAEELVNVLNELANEFNLLGLKLNEKKTLIGEINNGFDFLGYHFDYTGKSVPAKAEENLEERLETMWLTSGEKDIEEKCKKVLEIVGGWQQYFRENRMPQSVYEYVALIYSGMFSEYKNEMIEVRKGLINYNKDITIFLTDYWKSKKMRDMELLEYEQFFQMGISDEKNIVDSILLDELLSLFNRFIISEDRDIAIEIMQLYSDIHEYSIAEKWQEKCDALSRLSDNNVLSNINSNNDSDNMLLKEMNAGISYDKNTFAKYIHTFVGREDIYSKESFDYNRKRNFATQMVPLTEREIEKHLKGDETLDTYIQRQNSTVRHIIYDIDISKRILLKHAYGTDEYKEYMKLAADVTEMLVRVLGNLGIKAYIETSGNRGYHVWIFLTEWIPVRYAVMFSDIVLEKVMERHRANAVGDDSRNDISDTDGGNERFDSLYEDSISIESFPNKTRIKPGKFGQVIKLPYGIHVKTGVRSYFLDSNGNPIRGINHFIDGIAKYPLTVIKKVIAANSQEERTVEQKNVDNDITVFGDISPSVREVLTKCNLMRYLCQKSAKTNYLTHFERLSILYVFGHLGDDGKDFVHKVMSFTINYQYNVTDKFIHKMPEKPISCIKLREEYKKITAETGCNCSFKRTKNCYPSPVLHAISLSSNVEDVTLPVSRTITKEKEKTVINEINIHVKSQEIATKILEYKKQKRGLDKNIKKLEKELEEIFDIAKTDALEIEMGLLTRRKTDGGYEWVIEI